MANESPTRRKVLLINPRFQISIIAFMAGVSAVATGIFYVGACYCFWRFRSMGQAIGLPKEHVFFRFISEQEIFVNWGFLIVGAVAIIFIVGCGVFISHRVAGPLYRLQKHMGRVASGETIAPVAFRDMDYFPELAQGYNLQLEALKGTNKTNVA